MSDSTPPSVDPAPDLEQIVEIRNPAVDVNKVMADIRATLAQAGPLRQPEVPAFGMGMAEEAGELGYHLSQANLNYDQVWVETNVLRPAVPVAGAVLMRAKSLLHELAVYYVNLHAGKQINFNASLVRVLNALTRTQRDDVETLREEMARLRARIDELESKR